MRAEDAEMVAELTEQLGYPASAAQIRARVAAVADLSDHGLFVATSEGVVAGWIHVRTWDLLQDEPAAELGGLVVGELHRGQGVGEALLGAAEEWAQRRGRAVLWVRTNVTREGAHRFYEGRGYHRMKTSHTFRKELGAG